MRLRASDVAYEGTTWAIAAFAMLLLLAPTVVVLITSFTGAVPVPVPLRERNGFRVDTDELERLITDRSRLLIINSPHNPCGSALTREDCEAIAAIALRHDLTVLSDEV